LCPLESILLLASNFDDNSNILATDAEELTEGLRLGISQVLSKGTKLRPTTSVNPSIPDQLYVPFMIILVYVRINGREALYVQLQKALLRLYFLLISNAALSAFRL
jgi:hypothetical protein